MSDQISFHPLYMKLRAENEAFRTEIEKLTRVCELADAQAAEIEQLKGELAMAQSWELSAIARAEMIAEQLRVVMKSNEANFFRAEAAEIKAQERLEAWDNASEGMKAAQKERDELRSIFDGLGAPCAEFKVLLEKAAECDDLKVRLNALIAWVEGRRALYAKKGWNIVADVYNLAIAAAKGEKP